jgi:nucleoside 2-deoxyribosyltransferase
MTNTFEQGSIYFAAPLFSQAEKQFNAALTEKLEHSGFRVFLPQRDGIDGNHEVYREMTPDQRRRTIFQTDRDQILRADIFLFILDGRIPDEGACVELGMAYLDKHLAKPHKQLIGLMTDIRAAFIGAKLNPMLSQALDKIMDSEDELLTLLRQTAKP